MVDFDRLKALGDIERLCELLNHSDPGTRGQAAQALGELGRSRSAAPLVDTLSDEVWEVREAAKEALIRIGEAALPELEAILERSEGDVRRWCGETICAIGGPATHDLLKRLLKDTDDPRVRIAAATALGTTRECFTMEVLMEALEDDSWEVRLVALRGLGRLGTREALEPIRAALAGESNGKVQTAGEEVVRQLELL